MDTDGGDDVQALIRKVEMESLKSGKVDHRRDSAFLSLRLFAQIVPYRLLTRLALLSAPPSDSASRRRRTDVPPRFRPSTPRQASFPSSPSPSVATTPRATSHASSPNPPESPRSGSRVQRRTGHIRQLDVDHANRLASSPFLCAPPAVPHSAPPTRLAFPTWASSPGAGTERAQSPPFSDCSTLSSSSSSPFTPFDTLAPSAYPFPSSPRKSADDWAESAKGLPSLEMIQHRMRGREGVSSPTGLSFGDGRKGSARQGLPSFLLARRQNSQQSSSPPSSPTTNFSSFGGGLQTPPLHSQDRPQLFLSPPTA